MTEPAKKRKRYPKGPAKPGEVRAPKGRPCLYTPEIAAEVLRRISAGETLTAICKDAHMPAPDLVWDWTDEKCRPMAVPETFPSDFAQARARGHDALAFKAWEIACTPETGEEVTVKPDGSEEIRRGDMLGHRKLKVDTILKLLAKWDKRYGDRSHIDVSGALTLEQLVSASMSPKPPEGDN